TVGAVSTIAGGGGGGGGRIVTYPAPPVPPPPPLPGSWSKSSSGLPRSSAASNPTRIANAMRSTCTSTDSAADQRVRCLSSGSDARTRTPRSGTSAFGTDDAPVKPGSVGLDRRESDDLDPCSADDVDRLDDFAIGARSCRLDEEQLRRSAVIERVDLSVEIFLRERRLGVDAVHPVGRELEDDLRALLGGRGRGLLGRNLDLGDRAAHRVDDHEDDEEHKEHVDHRRHVDVRGDAAVTAAGCHRHWSVLLFV